MNPDDLAKILDELGTRLGPTGQHVFDLAVRYIVISSIVQIVFSVILLVILWGGIRWVYRHEFDISDDKEIVLILSLVIGVIISIVVLLLGGISLVSLLNPEYSAIRNILNTIHP